MARVPAQAISFFCDVLRYAGVDPDASLRAAGYDHDGALPPEVEPDVATRFVDHAMRAVETGGRASEVRLRSAFLVMLNHELRTPLNGLIGAAELLAQAPLDEPHRATLEELRRSVDAVEHSLHHLLALAGAMVPPRAVMLPPPVLEDPDDLRELATAEDPPRASAVREVSPQRVLVVDDNATNRVVATRLVERLGYEVHTASNGREAVAAVRDSHFDLVLMDCLMPEMDGFDATRAIREHDAAAGRRTPIVAVSANALDDERERCFASGMDDFVSKPIRGALLDRVLTRWCTRPPAMASDAPIKTVA